MKNNMQLSFNNLCKKIVAFSLAEMMVVMLILSIILAASMPIITKKAKAEQVPNNTIPTGSIIIWHGSVASISEGWHLCDGTSGTPDLRSRFVYGAGGDSNTKSSFATGWNNVNGHWAVGYTGGEEQHVLTIAEMPSHNHYSHPWTNFYRGQADGLRYGPNASYQSGTAALETSYTGGSQSHNILPRLMVLAYIMKL